jgi:hypothetical protein
MDVVLKAIIIIIIIIIIMPEKCASAANIVRIFVVFLKNLLLIENILIDFFYLLSLINVPG